MSLLGIIASGATTAIQVGATVGISTAKGNEFRNLERWKFGGVIGLATVGIRALWNFREGADSRRAVQETILDTAQIGLTVLFGFGEKALIIGALIAGAAEAFRQHELNGADAKTTVLSSLLTMAMTVGIARSAYFLVARGEQVMQVAKGALPEAQRVEVLARPVSVPSGVYPTPRLVGAGETGALVRHRRVRPTEWPEVHFSLEDIPDHMVSDPDAVLKMVALTETKPGAISVAVRGGLSLAEVPAEHAMGLLKRAHLDPVIAKCEALFDSGVWDLLEDDALVRRLAMNPDFGDGRLTRSGARGLINFLRRRQELFVGLGRTADRAFPDQTIIDPSASAEAVHQELIKILEKKLGRPVFLEDDLSGRPLRRLTQLARRLLLLPPRRG